MATWQVAAFDAQTNELVTWLAVQRLALERVRGIWGLPPHVPIGDLPITEQELGPLNALVQPAVQITAGLDYFLTLARDHPGEFVAETDGTRWYPAP